MPDRRHRRCCVPNCIKSSRDLKYFHFPSNAQRRAAWLAVLDGCQLSEKELKSAVVCSAHFRREDLQQNQEKTTLMPTAVPVATSIQGGGVPQGGLSSPACHRVEAPEIAAGTDVPGGGDPQGGLSSPACHRVEAPEIAAGTDVPDQTPLKRQLRAEAVPSVFWWKKPDDKKVVRSKQREKRRRQRHAEIALEEEPQRRLAASQSGSEPEVQWVPTSDMTTDIRRQLSSQPPGPLPAGRPRPTVLWSTRAPRSHPPPTTGERWAVPAPPNRPDPDLPEKKPSPPGPKQRLMGEMGEILTKIVAIPDDDEDVLEMVIDKALELKALLRAAMVTSDAISQSEKSESSCPIQDSGGQSQASGYERGEKGQVPGVNEGKEQDDRGKLIADSGKGAADIKPLVFHTSKWQVDPLHWSSREICSGAPRKRKKKPKERVQPEHRDHLYPRDGDPRRVVPSVPAGELTDRARARGVKVKVKGSEKSRDHDHTYKSKEGCDCVMCS